MEYRILGRTKLKVSIIGIGGGPFFSNEIPQQDINEIIKKGYENGINLLETGEDYDETKIGYALEKLKDSKIHIATKSTFHDETNMQKAIQKSLQKLKQKQIQIYQLHSINTPKELELRFKNGAVKALKQAQKEEKINFIGITGHHIPTLIKAIKTNEFDTVQVPYNLTHTLAEELFDICKNNNIGIMIMKPLGGGFLIDPKKSTTTPKPGKEHMTAENALKFILSNKKIHTTLIGMREPKQAEENTKITNQNLNLSEKERTLLSKKAKNFLGDNYCRTCKYCMPCAVHGWKFEIDTYLRYYGFYKKYGHQQFKEEYSKLKIKADACTQCGECEKKCPYNLPIIKMLKQAHLHLNSSFKKDYLKNEEKEQLIFFIKELKEDLMEKEKEVKKSNFDIIEYKTQIKNLQRFIKHKEKDEQNLLKQIEELGKELKEMHKKET